MITRSERTCNLKKKKTPYKQKSDGFTGEFYPIYKELILILLKLLQKFEEEGTVPKTLYEATISYPDTKTKDTTKKENYMPVSLVNIDAEILNKC